MNHKIVLLRHGESIWNKENRFTGWVDVELSEKGVEEAEEAGKILKNEGYVFDLVFTSVLKRAVDTAKIVLHELGLTVVDLAEARLLPISRNQNWQESCLCQFVRAWELNERHYGGLQGLNKAEMAAKYGEEQVRIWRRSYQVRPPEMEEEDYRKQNDLEVFKTVPIHQMPQTESLADTCVRAVNYWQQEIAPAIKSGKKVLISAHGNSLRAIIKYLDNIGDKEISELNIPTGAPLVYELDADVKPVKHYYLGDQVEIARKIAL